MVKKTTYWRISSQVDKDHPAILEAATYLREGKLVAFPTETVYGLGADATSTEAVQNIFQAKGRPSDNPLIVHIADPSQLEGVVDTSHPIARTLMHHFWPGPLTIVLPLISGAVSEAVTAGLDTLAIRMPDHPVALHLISQAGRLIAAPSANRSGRPSPTKGEHVKEDLDGLIDGILDAGETGVGLESTVVEILDDRVNILRPGGITLAQLQQVIPQVSIDEGLREAVSLTGTPRSPGMKYTHYAPKGRMTLVKGKLPEQVVQRIQQELDAASERGERTGVLTFDERASRYRADVVISCGSEHRPEQIAQKLYHALRTFDQEQVSCILAEACNEDGLGLAIMNRLMKASGNRIIEL